MKGFAFTIYKIKNENPFIDWSASVIKNILWDVDGTLFDTYPAITFAISKSLNDLGVSIALNVIDGLTRQSIELCFETLSQRFGLDIALLRHKFQAAYQPIPLANQQPFPGVSDICGFVCDRQGLNIVITHRSPKSTLELLKVHTMDQYFTDIFSSEQGYPRKPDPRMVQVAIDKYQLNPTQTLMVGDRQIDIQSGKSAGVQTCLYGKGDMDILPDYRIDQYNQLFTILKT